MNVLKRIKEYREQFRMWQRDSLRHIATSPGSEAHHCHCCEQDYTGDFCPTCGQRAGDKHLTWRSVRNGFMDLWGVGTRSLPYTLWQLLLRPGYLIADYITGRRQVSFPPIKMLVFVALFVHIVSNLISPGNISLEEESSGFELFDRFADWMEFHYDWAVLFVLSFLIIPTYYIFRHSPRCAFHTLPEGFFIQVFNATQVIFLILIYNLVGALFKSDESVLLVVLAYTVVFLVIYRAYWQLFGYSWWGTLWRLLMALIALIASFALVVNAFTCGLLAFDHDWERLKLNLFIRLPLYAGSFIASLWLSAWIDKRLWHKMINLKL